MSVRPTCLSDISTFIVFSVCFSQYQHQHTSFGHVNVYFCFDLQECIAWPFSNFEAAWKQRKTKQLCCPDEIKKKNGANIKCRKVQEIQGNKNKENYRKNDALRKKHSGFLLKLKDKGEYNLQKEKEKLRKRAEREKKKISSEPIPPATPTAASTLEPSTSASGSSSAFKHRCTMQRYMKKIEKYLPKSPAKRREVLGEIANKFCVKIDFSKRRGKMTDTLTNDAQVWINKFLDCPDISYMTRGRKDNVYTGK